MSSLPSTSSGRQTIPFEDRMLDQICLIFGLAFAVRLLLLISLNSPGWPLLCTILVSVSLVLIPIIHRRSNLAVAQTVFFFTGLFAIITGFWFDGGFEGLYPVLVISFIGAMVIVQKRSYVVPLLIYVATFLIVATIDIVELANIEPWYPLNTKYRAVHVVLFTLMMVAVMGILKKHLNFERERAGENNRFLEDLLNNREVSKKETYSFTLLKDAAQLVDQTNMVREKLLNTLSHNLRGPIARIYGILNMVANNQLTEEEQQQIGRGLQNDLDHILTLLDNLLYWSSIHNNGITLNPEDIVLKKAVDKQVAGFANSLQESGIWVNNKIEDDVVILGDPTMIDSILKNLLANAIRFSYNDSEVTVEAEIVLDMAKISIIDRGVGLTNEQFQNIFKTNKTVGIGPRNEKGSGIGLLISKEFTRRMGGQLEVGNEEGKGCIFSFTVPISVVTLQPSRMF